MHPAHLAGRLETAPFAGHAVVRRCRASGLARPWPVAVAIPARDEADRVIACLAAIRRSLDAGARPGGVVLVVNNSRDNTYGLARRVLEQGPAPHLLVDVRFGPGAAHVGSARRLALDLAAQATARDGVLLTTDADSRPAVDWVAETLRAIDAGADLVCGAIEPAAEAEPPLSAPLRARLGLEQAYARLSQELEARISPRAPLGGPPRLITGGASLACRWRLYRDVGGLPPLDGGEDRAFVEAALARDWRVRHVAAVRVLTSCRLVGRARNGMAETLAARVHGDAVSCDDALEPAGATLLRARARRALHACWTGGRSARPVLAGLGMVPEGIPLQDAVFFGEAWRRLEAASPVLARRPLPLDTLPGELGLMERMVAREQEPTGTGTDRTLGAPPGRRW